MKRITLLLLCFQTIFLNTNQSRNTMKESTFPYEVHLIQVMDSIDVAYVDVGEGDRTLLFVHGLGSNMKAWWKTIEGLKGDYRCIAIDLPGYGLSSKGEYNFSMSFFAKVTSEVISQLKLNPVTLIGHSMGGQVAMHTVLNGTQRTVDQMVLVAPAGFEVFSDAQSAWLKGVFTSDFVKSTPVDQIRRNFENNFFDMPDDAEFMVEDRLVLRASEDYDSYCTMIPKCMQGMLDEPVFDYLPNIALPTLVIFGEEDKLIPSPVLHPELSTIEVARSGQKRIDKSSLVLVSKAGHFVQWEGAAVVNSEIATFVNSVHVSDK